MKIIVKIGGSVSIGSNGPDFSYFSKLLPVLRSLKKDNTLVIAIGGGQLTRQYAKSIEKFGITNTEKEKIFLYFPHPLHTFFVSPLFDVFSTINFPQ